MAVAHIMYLYLTHTEMLTRKQVMTTDEKVAAFDLLTVALTNQWHDGTWSANCTSLVEQPSRDSREACIPDLLAWAQRVAAYQNKRQMRVAATQAQENRPDAPPEAR